LPLFLDFAIGACECLELLHHGQGIVHGELRGDAFHFNIQTSVVKLVNFGSGARSFEHYLTSKGWSTLSKEVGANNKLQYIAPEMTGRMQAEPDSRTDIYSLGVLLWILLTRQLPFEGETPMDIVQNVLARRIPPVSSKRMDIPPCLSQIIQKMTMKQIDERYHSTSGLKRDLIEVQQLLADGDSEGLQNFKLGAHDVSSFFCLPSSMIGRKEEHDKIVRVIAKVSKRHSATGGPGSGASSLKKNGLFSISSNSSISEGRPDNGDGSSDGTSSHGGDIGSRSTPGPTQTFANTANYLGSIPEDRGDPLEGQASSSNKHSRSRGEGTDAETLVDLHRHPSHSRDHESSTRRRNSQKLRQKGRCEVVSISGAGGMGKSTLSRSISVEARRHGYFASAKFDQAQKTPFGPVLRLLSSLFKQLFSESEVTTEFHQTVRSYVRPHWTVLHRMLDLPEFLLGQPTGLSKSNSISTHHYSTRKSSVVELKRRDSSPSSTRSSIFHANMSSRPAADFLRGGSSTRSLRFMNTFLEVLRLFAQHKFICLCLDDLQFADEESLELISNIVSSKIRLVLIVTYREREILGEKVRSVLESENAAITKIKLPPLDEENIVDYVATTLSRPREYVIPLAAVLQEKTRGNPFYMREMLDTCHRKNALWYDWKSSSWVYDLDRVFKEFETANYAEVLSTDFITRRLQELPSSATSILAWSSLLGTFFSFSLVQKLLSGEFDYNEDGSSQPTPGCGGNFVSLSHEDAVGGLQCALQSYVILATEEDDIFRFAHDRYVQAAASLRECRNVQKMHLVVAQVMMKYYSLDEQDIYVPSDHVCQAVPLILKRFSIRYEFRDLLFQAAQKASENGARHAAINYYRNCIQLLQPDPWTDGLPDVYYEETLQLHTRAAECYWYQGHFDEALSILQVTFNKAKTPVDKAPSWVLQSRLFAQRRDPFGCVQSLRQCLSTLGLQIKEDITWEECDNAFHKLCQRLQSIDRAELFQTPRTDDPVLVAVGAVLVEMVSSCYWSDSLLFYNAALALVNLHLDRGAFVQAGVGYTYLAMIAASRFNMIQFATEMGEISLYLVDKSHDPLTTGRGGTTYPIFVGHLRDHVRDTIPQMEAATENSVIAGDRTLTLLSLGATAMNKFYCVEDLEDVESFCAYITEEVPAWSDDTRGGTIVTAVRQVAKALMGKTKVLSPLDNLSDETHDSPEYIKKLSDEEPSNGDRPLFLYLSFAIAPLYLYGHYDRAIECGTQCVQNIDLLFSTRPTRFMLFVSPNSSLPLTQARG
jgi:predicted ATPase/serine/threonine protein kinase